MRTDRRSRRVLGRGEQIAHCVDGGVDRTVFGEAGFKRRNALLDHLLSHIPRRIGGGDQRSDCLSDIAGKPIGGAGRRVPIIR